MDLLSSKQSFLNAVGVDFGSNTYLSNKFNNYKKFKTFKDVCPNTKQEFRFEHDFLESVGFYQVVDCLGEGEIEGLTDQNGKLIKLTSQASKNEDGFKGLYLNDVPVKNTNSSTLNYNRVFFDFKVGSERQSPLSNMVNNPVLSFENTIQTANMGVALPSLFISADGFRDNVGNYLRDKGVRVPTQEQARAASSETTTSYKINQAGNNQPAGFYIKTGWGGARLSHYSNFVIDLQYDRSFLNLVKSMQNRAVVFGNYTVKNDNVDSLVVDMRCNRLMYGTGGWNGVSFVVITGYVGDPNTILDNGSLKYYYCNISGRSSSVYERSFVFDLPPSYNQVDRFIKIFRTDAKNLSNVENNKDLSVKSIGEITRANQSYPFSAVAGLVFDARSFGNVPKRTFSCRLKKINIPDNYFPETREYVGDWSGNFATVKKWSDNPAWILYDVISNTRYGAGKFGFKEYFLDKWHLYKIAKYCDELVPTGYPGRYPALDFTITSGSVQIGVSNNLVGTSVSEEKIKQMLPEGAVVSIVESKNEGGSDLSKYYQRLIIGASFSGSTYSFKLVEVPSPDTVFLKYPEEKKEYNDQLKPEADGEVAFDNSFDYLIDKLIQNNGNQFPDGTFLGDYLNGAPLDLEVESGKVAVHFEGFKPLLEPRFRCNVMFTGQQNALNTFNDIAAIFRGMIYWSAGSLFVSNDQKRDPVLMFNNSNVKDGSFVYTGSASTARHTAVVIRFNDENDNFKPKVEYLEDAVGIRNYGYLEKEMIALGVTSRSQAHRLARWLLYTAQTETDLVQFTTGQEGSYLRPGDVVLVQDKLKTSKRYGGRVKAINHGAKQITLDEGIEEDISGQKIHFIIPQSNRTSKELNDLGRLRIETNNPGVTDDEIDSTSEPQVGSYTISSVSETNVVTLASVDEKFTSVKKGYIWSVENLNADFKIKPIKYRVISVVEQNSNEYSVTCMMYNETKFAAVDESKSVENTQQSLPQIADFGTLPEPLVQGTSEISVSTATFDPVAQTNIIFDGAFEPSNQNIYEDGYKQSYVEIDFSALAIENAVNASNTGGYILEVDKNGGERIRVTLDGYDSYATPARILLGDEREKNASIVVKIYRYDASKKLESTGLPRNND